MFSKIMVMVFSIELFLGVSESRGKKNITLSSTRQEVEDKLSSKRVRYHKLLLIPSSYIVDQFPNRKVKFMID